MGSYASNKLTLKGPHTKQDFLRLYKKCKDKRLAERYQAMYLSFKYSWEEIAEIAGRDYQTVLEWARLYNKHGLEGLRLGKPPGRPSSLSDKELDELKNTVQIQPRKLGLPFSNWNLKGIGKWIKDSFGIVFSKEGVRKILYRIGFICIKPSYVFILADKKGQKSFVRKLKRRLKQGKTVLFGDESTAQQHPTLHRMWTLRGIRPQIPTLGNHKKKKVFGVINPFTGNSLCKIASRLSADEFVAFMDDIKAHYRGYNVVLCVDNFPTHKAEKVKEYCRENSDWLEILFLPAYSPQFNPIEQLWKCMKYKVTHNTFYMKIEELENSLEHFFSEIKDKKSVVASICSVDYLVD